MIALSQYGECPSSLVTCRAEISRCDSRPVSSRTCSPLCLRSRPADPSLLPCLTAPLPPRCRRLRCRPTPSLTPCLTAPLPRRRRLRACRPDTVKTAPVCCTGATTLPSSSAASRAEAAPPTRQQRISRSGGRASQRRAGAFDMIWCFEWDAPRGVGRVLVNSGAAR